MTFTAGARIGQYEILAAVGAGGMGEVYRARDSQLRRDVALKVLPDVFAADAERLARFEREAQVLASLNHQHIAQIYGVESSNGFRTLVMEFVDGEDLAKRLARGALPIGEALDVARQIADALEAAHERGIVHRDLKPSNIALTPEGKVKVLDFGLAKAGGINSGNSITDSPTVTFGATQLGVILGTAAYMSPEQAKGRAADKRSDIWAFGCVLYEMLAGRRAFEGDDLSDTLAAVLKDHPDWTRLPAETPVSIRRVLKRCLEKDHRRRLADISDARLELDEASSTPEAISVRPASPVFGWRRALPAGLAALTAAALTSAAWWTFGPHPPPPPVVRFSIPLGTGEAFTGLALPAVAVSPDGTHVAYSANSRLYLRPLTESSARAIVGTEVAAGNVYGPTFSPDGRSIAFLTGTTSLVAATLKRIAITGGVATPICDVGVAMGMTWSGDHIVFAARDGIMRVSAHGGQPEQLVRIQPGEIVQRPQMLPGDDAVLFTVLPGGVARRAGSALALSLDTWDTAHIVVHSLTTGARKTVIEGGSDARYVPTGHLVYAVRGVLFARAFDVSRLAVTSGPLPILEGVLRSTLAPSTGATHASISDAGALFYIPGPVTPAGASRRLVFVDRAGTIEPLKVPDAAYEAPRLSPDGTRLAFGIDDGNSANVWIYDLSGSSSMRQLTFEGRNAYPIWSRDGQHLAFQSNRGGDTAIFWQRADGTTPAERLTTADAGSAHVPEAWSPDGRTVLFGSIKGAVSELWTLSVADRKAAPFPGVRSAVATAAAFSPDGRWVTYSVRESAEGNNALYVQPFPPTGAKYLITPNGFRPLWSPDGKELFFARRGLSFVVSVSTAPSFTFGEPVELPIRRFAPPAIMEREYDVTRDGRRFIFALPPQANEMALAPRIQAVLNWFEELKQRVPRH